MMATLVLAVAAYIAMFGLWVGSEVAARDAFVAAALESFDRPGSDDALGGIIAAEFVEEVPALESAESALATLFSLLITTEPFEPLRIDVSRQVYEVAVGGAPGGVVVDLSIYRDTVLDTVGALSSGLAQAIPESAFGTFEIIEPGELPDASGAAVMLPRLGWLSLVLALFMAGLLVVVTRDARVFLIAMGAGLLLAGVLIAIVIVGSSSAAESVLPFEGSEPLAANLSSVLNEPLAARALIVGIMGAVMILAGVVARALGARRLAVSAGGRGSP